MKGRWIISFFCSFICLFAMIISLIYKISIFVDFSAGICIFLSVFLAVAPTRAQKIEHYISCIFEKYNSDVMIIFKDDPIDQDFPEIVDLQKNVDGLQARKAREIDNDRRDKFNPHIMYCTFIGIFIPILYRIIIEITT
jgi:hypothetical protein